jgi:hypothetical protein
MGRVDLIDQFVRAVGQNPCLLINRAFKTATGLSPEDMPTIDVWKA